MNWFRILMADVEPGPVEAVRRDFVRAGARNQPGAHGSSPRALRGLDTECRATVE